MSYRIKYTVTAAGLIGGFPPELKKMLREAMDELRENPALGKYLVNELGGFQSLARKRYRIIYKTDSLGKTILIYYAGHRRDIYELFRAHLEKKDLA